MNDRRIHEIINESINGLLISEGLFGNNKTLTYVKQIADNLNDTLSSLSKGVSLNQIVFKPNNSTNTNNYQNNPYQQNNQSQETNANDNDGIIYPDENEWQTIYDGDALDVQEAKGGRGSRRRNVRGNLNQQRQQRPQQKSQQQQQPQLQQQQLTPQQQQIQSNVPEVVRCWSWGRQILSETVALLKQYLELNGIKESLFYDGMLVEDGANGTMVNPMQILRGGWQSGKSGYMRGYRQAQNLIDKFNKMRDRYKQQKATLKNKEKVNQRIENNVKEYFNFCSVVENCQQQISIVSANIVFGQEIEHDIEVMTSSEIKGYYQNILKYVVPTNNKKQQKKAL